MKIGIVGSRTFPQLKLVEWFVADLPLGVVVVSGAAEGVDAAAAEYARRRGLEVLEHAPDLRGCKERHEFSDRFYARNQRIVDDVDLLVAFTEKDRGGTWDTIKRAQRAGKPIKIIKPSLLFPGDADPAPEASRSSSSSKAGKEGELALALEAEALEVEESPQQAGRTANKGKGPFAIKRVSLGSYAIRRKCYIPPEEWAAILTEKDDNAPALAARMTPDFVRFFDNNKRLGFVHAITVPPRSKRNLGKDHAMDRTAAAVAGHLGIPFVVLFEPWDKASRGRHAKHGEIRVVPEVARHVGRVLWVLDDVTTTNVTLRSAVQSLMALEIHAHGLAWILMA